MIFEIKTFGEKRLVLTFKALVSFFTLPSVVVLLEPSKVEKLVSTELAHNLAIIQTSPTGLESNKVLLCCKGLVTWMVAEKGFAVFVNSF